MTSLSQNESIGKWIGLIFDRSFMIYDIQIPMGIIANEMFRYKKNANYVYGGIPRLCYHVEEYGRSLHISPEKLHKICIPDADQKLLSAEQMNKWFMEFTNYPINRIIVLRDNQHTGETERLLTWAITNKIQTLEFDNRGNCLQPVQGAIYEDNYYNKTVYNSRNCGRKYR